MVKHFQDRSDIQLQNRWFKVLGPKIVMGPWTKEEDNQMLKIIMEQFAGRHREWSVIASQLQGRTLKQCRDR